MAKSRIKKTDLQDACMFTEKALQRVEAMLEVSTDDDVSAEITNLVSVRFALQSSKRNLLQVINKEIFT